MKQPEQRRKERLREVFLELIAINEVYPDEDEIITYVAEFMRGIGLEPQLDSFRNVLAKSPGEGEPILLNTHMDIPESAPRIEYTETEDTLHSTGNSILGADPKSGLAALLVMAEEHMNEPREGVRPVEFFFTRGEEAGLKGAIAADYSLLEAKEGIVLDDEGGPGTIPTKAPGYIEFDISFEGKTAHVIYPEVGINAVEAMCAALQSVGWRESTPGVSWNPGICQGGTAKNSIPGSAHVSAEMRSFDTELLKKEAIRVAEKITSVGEKNGCKVTVRHQLHFAGYEHDLSDPLLQRAAKVLREMGLEAKFFEGMGGTDANVFCQNGIACFAIGAGYHNPHEYTEWVDWREMSQVVEFLHHSIKN